MILNSFRSWDHGPGVQLSFWVYIVCVCTAFSCASPEEPIALPDHIDFNFHVRPILSNQCFLCHGPDSSSREADLRLDLAATATADRDGRRAIVPGDAQSSEMIKRILSDDPSYRMPPPHTNKILSDREKAILTKWIDGGAEWKPYWAFIEPQARGLKDNNGTHPVDFFVQRNQIENGLHRAQLAEKHTLIRRLAYLLTGIPPTEEEISDFLANQKEDAYAKLVDHYLASEQYGERWARHWMDLARYAEGKGHEFDYPVVGAWRYRDYLIRAFNQDVPYDDFVKEQIAGDLVPKPRVDPQTGLEQSHLGTAFLLMAEGKHSPVDIKEEEKIMIDNMIDVTSKTFQGLTVACARCHDHKFDPIPTTDYYSLYGIFESSRQCVTGASKMSGRSIAADSIEDLRMAIRAITADHLSEEIVTPKPLPASIYSSDEVSVDPIVQFIGDFRRGGIEGWYADGYAFGGINQLGQPKRLQNKAVEFYQEGLVSSKHYGTGVPGALRSPTFIVDKRYLWVRGAGKHSMIRVVSDNFQLIQNPIYGSIAKQVDSDVPQDYMLDLKMIEGHKAYVELLVGEYHVKRGKNHYYHLPEDAWIEASFACLLDSLGDGDIIDEVWSGERLDKNKALDNWVNATANPDEIGALIPYLDPISGSDIAAIWSKIDNLTERLRDTTFIVGLTEGDRVLSPVFVRGDHNILSAEKVPHRFFTAIDSELRPFDETSSGRMEFANAITSRDNPLTARVMVNRIWHHLFGRGIVATVDNFGLQGSIPSHPELLDYLAIKFMDDGWSIKKLVKFIVTSQTFQLATERDSVTEMVDPTNIYLSHFPVRRLDAEAIRDGMLAVSGDLDLKMYGPSIPIYLTPFLNGRGKPPASGPLNGYGRRSIYQAIWRNFLPPMMLTFDMPIPFSTFGRRSVTNVPAQSLTLLNDEFVIEQAAAWATRLLNQDSNFEENVSKIYLTAFSRRPSRDEIENCKRFIVDQGGQRGLDSLDSLGSQPLWAELCHSIFNMKEFIYLL